jgi:hypothetical protein
MNAFGPAEPGWHWRNCRRLSLNLDIRIWPFLSMGLDKTEDVYGGERWAWFGPVGFGVRYDIGNRSDPSINGRGALSEAEAWERACRFEGIAQ